MTQTQALYLIGVDGGGSRCRFALANAAGRVLARHEEGAANISSNFDAAAATIHRGVAAVQVAAALPEGARYVVHMGLAGANAVDLVDRLRQGFGPQEVVIEDDRRTAVTAALGGKSGAVASCGTGSFVCRQTADDLLSLGGWGLHLGDDASGAWLGQAGLRRAVLALDGLLPMTGLLRDLAARAGNDRSAMIGFARAAQPRDYAALAPLVIEAAKAGDAEGKRLMQAGADYLTAALQVLGHDRDEPLCLLGGVGRHYAPWMPGFDTAPPALPAVSGALMLAARKAGISIEDKPWT